MRAKTIREILLEWGGAGYSVYGGSASYGNPGRGFGQSSANKGGSNLMYTYDVKDLNQSLQVPPTIQDAEKYIHIGCEVKAKSLLTKKWIEGKIVSAKNDPDGNLLNYEVLNIKTGKNELVDPTSVELIDHDPGLSMAIKDVVGESFYPNFERGSDPKYSMELGAVGLDKKSRREVSESDIYEIVDKYFEETENYILELYPEGIDGYKEYDRIFNNYIREREPRLKYDTRNFYEIFMKFGPQ